ncbi:MAG: outer membrane lipoprotein-sorting protein, partial [Spirosomataceae bacterium]
PVMVDGKEMENATYYFFDKDSGVQIMTRSEAKVGPMKGMTVEALMSDYQEVEGLYFPFSMENKINGQSQASIVIDKIELNKEVDNAMFAFPE